MSTTTEALRAEIRDDLKRLAVTILGVTHAHCSCGGGSPEDGCAACKLWHALMDETHNLKILAKYKSGEGGS